MTFEEFQSLRKATNFPRGRRMKENGYTYLYGFFLLDTRKTDGMYYAPNVQRSRRFAKLEDCEKALFEAVGASDINFEPDE